MEAQGRATVIDLTIDPEDHFTALPSELISTIIDYLLPAHDPDLIHHAGDGGTLRVGRPYDLASLHFACRRLHAETTSWAETFMRRHKEVTRYKEHSTSRAQAKRDIFIELLRWLERHCVFCGKKSVRTAILANGLRCCGPCDKQQWPRKVTKTQALYDYDLRPHHILPPHLRVSRKQHATGLEQIRYGTYFAQNVPTTMFLRDDVRAVAYKVHGPNLIAYLRKRADARIIPRVEKAQESSDACRKCAVEVQQKLQQGADQNVINCIRLQCLEESNKYGHLATAIAEEKEAFAQATGEAY